MTTTTQPSYFAGLFDTVWSPVPETKVENQSLADTLFVPFEDKLPQHLSDDQIETDKVLLVLLYMIMDDIPRTTIHSILRSDSYDILVPSNISAAPYIAISYSDDTEEEHSAFISDTCPAQDSNFLTVPPPDVMEDYDEDEDEDPKLDWDVIAEDLETFLGAAGLDELEDLESAIELEDYFAGCDSRLEIITPLDTSGTNLIPSS
ncbi:unnamed protein product [Rhizoctonia solani]|uniref:Uncharacterized protein n=1 Tax=Rhizoctonia solani TaxID=456999 RepID=A0A8H3AR82_9AGAM|nr:unnamed protein product [Rhizoctonia solani]